MTRICEKVLHERQELGGLLQMGIVSRLLHDSEPGLRNHPAERLAIVGRNDAVMLAPHEQRWYTHAMEPLLQLGIVQAGIPAEAGKRFVVAGDDSELALRHRAEVAFAFLRIETT